MTSSNAQSGWKFQTSPPRAAKSDLASRFVELKRLRREVLQLER
jgi:hypothetical protein